jgi:uncharacterized protein YecE (DUF72 family)
MINKRAYLRFHGNPPYSSLYPYHVLSESARGIKSAVFDEVWIYFNNDQNAYAIRNALELRKFLEGQNNL